MKRRWQIVNTWNGGALGEKIEFTATKPGTEGHNECFLWVHQHTPFSFAEATKNQGYEVREVEIPDAGELPPPPPLKQSSAKQGRCDFCGESGTVVCSEQVRSGGVAICGPCVTWAEDELKKARRAATIER